ncbi:NEDD4-like E3 ubiquitin-protein ligase WWP1 [Gracilariopsis chorda]|uniref:NEDD4-like E3 ubiquitin-protein ligase WWP1 n=1 Tax=Gracilariopsis chorda TaxID=448386 RepID=A0A2V3IJA2_9FLOR|nr:NEDD4-like E3 ubiquitin-protein ligase WWP1 [Gracilariopsis chorda]|eukprot:PXF42176.1 NEDD4-like E3 ubiquitin-protein ligase WWP1 [Gracilariopsis chorda]
MAHPAQPPPAITPALTSAAEAQCPKSRPRAKKKVRMQVIPDEEPIKPVDTFHVSLSNAHAVLRIAESRPVILKFAFDNYWHAETDVFTKDSVQPQWNFNTDTIRGFDGRKPAAADGTAPHQQSAPTNPVQPSTSFVYETQFGYKLHRKYLIVTLCERSPYQDVEWGTGVIPLDSIARGCESADMSIVAKDGLTYYGNVYCNITMTNVQRVRAHLTDLKLSEYPEVFSYDVKLIYLEFGTRAFENGFCRCTERRSDAEPRFSAQPALQYDTTLRDMLVTSTPNAPAIMIFFSVHRQVARNRTEEIGVGALPIRMLFSKIRDGWMNLPTKFRVPLANYRGIIRGKVLLRNIPQFSQLPGSDLTNVDGVIMPVHVDLQSRKLLPWIKLPKSTEKRRQMATENQATQLPYGVNHHHLTPSVSDKSVQSETTREPSVPPTSQPQPAQPQQQLQAPPDQPHDPHSTEYDGGSEPSSNTTSPRLQRRPFPAMDTFVLRDNLKKRAAVPRTQQIEPPQHDTAAHGSPSTVQRSSWAVSDSGDDSTGTISKLRSKVDPRASSHVEQIKLFAALREASRDNEGESCEELSKLRISDSPGRSKPRQHSDESSSSRVPTSRASDGTCDGRESPPDMQARRNKSGKSFGSSCTTEGGVEVGSTVLSDDGYLTGSRTNPQDANQKLTRCAPGEEQYDYEAEDMRATYETSPNTSLPGLDLAEGAYDDDEDEWQAIHDPGSSRHYFAHRHTQESLWLPPGWERMVDDDGRQYFVDHASQSTQWHFPAAEARAYRESVYAG